MTWVGEARLYNGMILTQLDMSHKKYLLKTNLGIETKFDHGPW